MDFRADHWAELTPAAAFSARYYHRMCVGNGYMYLTGGYASGVASSEVWRSADGETWQLLTAAPGWGARGAHGCLFMGGKIYVFGGSNEGGTYYNDCWSSADGISWTQETAAAGWGSRHQMGYCVHDNKLYISGGYNPAGGGVGTFYADVWSSTNGSTWSLVDTNFGASIRQHSMVSFLGDLWIYGGNDSNIGPHNTIWHSDNDGVSWVNEGSMGFLRYDMSAVVNDTATQLVLIGGRTNTGAYVDVALTTDGINFSAITQVTPHQNTQSRAVLYENTLYTVGGRYGSTDRNDVWKEQYQIVYNDNGAPGSSQPVDSTLYSAEDTATILGAGGMSWYGHSFNRWNTAQNGTGTNYDPSDPLTFTDSGVVTLYAMWDVVPLEFHVEAVGSNTFPYDTRAKAATNFHELFDGLDVNASITELEELWTVYAYGTIIEPTDAYDWFEGNGAPVIGEDPQTTIIDLDTSSFETINAKNCTFFTDNANAAWNTAIYDPYGVENCKFDGRGYWYQAIEFWYTERSIHVLGSSFENFLEYSMYIRENGLSANLEVIIANNSFDNPTAPVEMFVQLLSCTVGKVYIYNNVAKGNSFVLDFDSLVINDFLHDHNISLEGYDYTMDGVPFATDATETEQDPLFLYVDPNNRLAIDGTSPAAGAGIFRVSMPTVDLFGTTFVNPPSMGAYEISEGPTRPDDFNLTYVRLQADSGLPNSGVGPILTDTVFKSYRSFTTRLIELLDPLKCPIEFLPYLARVLGYNLKHSDFAVSADEVFKKRVQIRELAKWYSLKGTNRGFEFIFQIVGYSTLNPELAWVDKSQPDPRDYTAWNVLGTHPGDPGFVFAIGGSTDPNDYVPDSRVRVDLSGQGSVPPAILESAKDRIREVKPYHLIFDFTSNVINITGDDAEVFWMYGRPQMFLDKTVTNVPFGDETTQIEVMSLGGGDFQYAFTGTGTDPVFGDLDVGDEIRIEGSNFNAGNVGTFDVIDVGTMSFRVNNPSGVPEIVTIGSDGRISTPYLLDENAQEEKFYLTMAGSQDIVRIRAHPSGEGIEPTPMTPGPLTGEKGWNGEILVVKGNES